MIDFIFTAGLIDQLDGIENSRQNPRSMEDSGGSGTDFWKIFEGLLGRTGLIFAENQAADNENSPSGLEMTESTDDVDHQLFPLSIGLQPEEAGIESEASNRSELRKSELSPPDAPIPVLLQLKAEIQEVLVHGTSRLRIVESGGEESSEEDPTDTTTSRTAHNDRKYHPVWLGVPLSMPLVESIAFLAQDSASRSQLEVFHFPVSNEFLSNVPSDNEPVEGIGRHATKANQASRPPQDGDLPTAWIRLAFADDKSIEDVNQFIRLNTLSNQALGDPARANENLEEGNLNRSTQMLVGEGIWIELPNESFHSSKDQVLQLGSSDSIDTRFKDLDSAYFLDDDRQPQNPLQSLKRPNLPQIPGFLIAESDRVLGEEIEPVEFVRRFDLSASRAPDSSEELQAQAKPEKENQVRVAKSVDLVNSILTTSDSKAKGASPRHTLLSNHVPETGDHGVLKGDGETAARKQSPENPSPKQSPPAALKRLVFVPAKAMEGIKEPHSVNARPVDSNQVDLKGIEPRLELLNARPHSTGPTGDETAKQNMMAGGGDKSHQEVKPPGALKTEPTAANTIIARSAEAEGADPAPMKTSRMGLAGMSERADGRERAESRQQQKANRAQSSFSHKIVGLGAEKADNSGAKPSLDPYPASAFGERAEQVERIEQAAPNSQKGQWQVLERNAGISLVTQKPIVVENSPFIPVEYKESRYRLQGETLRNAVDQIVQSARLKISEGRQEIQVKLKPEFLGMVKIVVESTQQEIKAVLFVERPELRQALEGQFPQLQRSLQEQSIRLDRLDIRDFSAQMNSGGGSNEQGMRRGIGGQNSHLSQSNMGIDASVISARDGQITNREFGYNTLELIA
ncbi:MAG: flagellar hook-length control protein FliK [bacterium]